MISWKAIYKDDTSLPQYNGDGTENHYQDIDRWKLVRFELHKNNIPFYALYLHRGQRLIYRMRVFKPLNKPDVIVYMVGWQETIETKNGSRNITVINYIHPDGSVSLDDSRNNLQLVDSELI
jgi:hypothetical protein